MNIQKNSDMKYFKDKNALSMPWVESPFFYELLKNSDLTQKQKDIAIKYHEQGYLIIDLNLQDIEINDIMTDVYKAIDEDTARLQADHYQYNESPRVFEGWKESQNIKDLVLNKKIMDTLQFLYQKEPLPFSTINFIKGSNQPLHSDAIHFHTIPQLWMVGVWVALENSNKNNGGLRIVPGSHKWGTYEYHNLNLPHPDNRKNGEKENYRDYEQFIRELVIAKKGKEIVPEIKKGQALIWASNMLHGGTPIIDKKSTRKSQAIHYFFEGCEHYYHPMFSEPLKGKYAKKWCNDKNNIKTTK